MGGPGSVQQICNILINKINGIVTYTNQIQDTKMRMKQNDINTLLYDKIQELTNTISILQTNVTQLTNDLNVYKQNITIP